MYSNIICFYPKKYNNFGKKKSLLNNQKVKKIKNYTKENTDIESNGKLSLTNILVPFSANDELTKVVRDHIINSDIKIYEDPNWSNNYNNVLLGSFLSQTNLFNMKKKFKNMNNKEKISVYKEYKKLDSFHLKILFISENKVYVGTLTHATTKKKLFFEPTKNFISVIYNTNYILSKVGLTGFEIYLKNSKDYNNDFLPNNIKDLNIALKSNKTLIDFLHYNKIQNSVNISKELKSLIIKNCYYIKPINNFDDINEID